MSPEEIRDKIEQAESSMSPEEMRDRITQAEENITFFKEVMLTDNTNKTAEYWLDQILWEEAAKSQLEMELETYGKNHSC